VTVERAERRRGRIIRGLLASEGLTETEEIEALEAFAAKLITAGGREENSGATALRRRTAGIPSALESVEPAEDAPESLGVRVLAGPGKR